MLRHLFSPLWIIEWLGVFCLGAALAVSCAPQPQEAKNTDYYDHTVNYHPTAEDIAAAKAQWRQDEGEFQPNLTPETERYLKQKVAEMRGVK
ncbi:hypothetical protein HPC38_02465 [Pasteurellaceae bacterium HPA106]|uniref:hypothetical protein n=1 Tax=Spirabiliibacterium pneumoniae TaxID=221400 RepID=UPI001AAD20D9|nr:hypothetical protein [Spirabiliibacterium pneumoniae]MBE2895743.1 hypothetical protein [Spirabiliibacterium pneumoniae]